MILGFCPKYTEYIEIEFIPHPPYYTKTYFFTEIPHIQFLNL